MMNTVFCVHIAGRGREFDRCNEPRDFIVPVGFYTSFDAAASMAFDNRDLLIALFRATQDQWYDEALEILSVVVEETCLEDGRTVSIRSWGENLR